VIFFFDACVSRYVAYMLGHFDRNHQMRASVDHFKEGTPDKEWMPVVASWGDDVVVVSGDGRILRNRAEKQVLKECRRTFVCLAPVWPKLPWEEYAWRFVKVWPDIIKNVQQARYPTVFEVSHNLKVQSTGRIDQL
jgi:hypothetical protein